MPSLIVAAVALPVLVYSLGLARCIARGTTRWPVAKWRVSLFFAGAAMVLIALLEPVDALADTRFAMHMAQHLLLVFVAAPAFAASDAHLIMLRALARAPRLRVVAALDPVRRASHRPAASWLAGCAFAIALVTWHVPAIFDWAAAHEWAHAVEHGSLLVTAIAFWRVVLTSGQRRFNPGMAVVMVTLVGVLVAFTGALIALAPQPLYGPYAGNPPDDQALAGVMMCIPASFLYLASSIWALARLLRPEPRRSRRG
jgi:putative membrane protein